MINHCPITNSEQKHALNKGKMEGCKIGTHTRVIGLRQDKNDCIFGNFDDLKTIINRV